MSSDVGDRTGIGAPVRRVEDRRFLTGQGRFTDDVSLPNVAFGYVVRSPHAHARIVGVDAMAAKAMPGVLAVLTANDLHIDKIGPLKCYSFPVLPVDSHSHRPVRSVLATDYVRHVGDCVAFVVAETRDQAKDAAEHVSIDYEPLPAVTLVDALSKDAPRVWQDARDNVCFRVERGSRHAVDRAFANAAHVTELSVDYPRACANTIEPRSVLAQRDGDGRFTLWLSSQAPYRLRDALADVMGIREIDLRVVSQDVGGGFGMKGQSYPEDVLTLGRRGGSIVPSSGRPSERRPSPRTLMAAARLPEQRLRSTPKGAFRRCGFRPRSMWARTCASAVARRPATRRIVTAARTTFRSCMPWCKRSSPTPA
jgi:carbon-monoxide dehydrogenase large subunit